MLGSDRGPRDKGQTEKRKTASAAGRTPLLFFGFAQSGVFFRRGRPQPSPRNIARRSAYIAVTSALPSASCIAFWISSTASARSPRR